MEDTSSALLSFVPEADRTVFLSKLVETSEPENTSFAFVVNLVEIYGSPTVRDRLLAKLERAIDSGNLQVAVDVYQRHPRLGAAILARLASSLREAKSDNNRTPSDVVLQSYLKLLRLLVSRSPIELNQAPIDTYLSLLHSTNEAIHPYVKDLVLEFLSLGSSSDTALPQAQSDLWKCVQQLLASNQEFRNNTGYALWLRCLLSRSSLLPTPSEDYWRLILEGLRHGDAEQRKLCLNILRLSAAVSSTGLSDDLRRQYDRYATVFETIVLGRYINQVMECKNDLDFFAQDAALNPIWLFTLLGAALDSHMQDSNRKFIGNWTMSAGLPISLELIDFFEKDFLPWATQGQHFVATTKNADGTMVCLHGQHLARFVARLRAGKTHAEQVTHIVVQSIIRKRNSMFAYCTVWLLEGIGDTLNEQQRIELSQLRGLPEVARDYLSMKTNGKPTADAEGRTESVREIRQRHALQKLHDFSPNEESLEDIWTDVEYLEYSKKLIMALPAVLLSADTLASATRNAELASNLKQKIETLQQVATTKTFLFPPLMVDLRRAVLSGPEAFELLDLPALLAKIAEKPPTPTIDLLLEETVIPLTPYTYEHYFGEKLSYGVAAYIDLVSRLGYHSGLLKAVLDHILKPWKSQKTPPPTVSPWKNALQLQVIFLCYEQYSPPSEEELHAQLEDLFRILSVEPLPSYRYMLEAIIVQMVMRHDLGDTLLERLSSKDHHSNPKHLASLMKIGTILACTPETSEQFAARLATTFVPLAASSKIVIRHEAQWQTPVLFDHARATGWKTITDNPAINALDDYIRSLERFHEPPLERQIGRFDPAKDATLTNLVEGQWYALDSIETPLTSRDEFIKLHDQHPLPQILATCIPLGDAIDRPTKAQRDPTAERVEATPATPSPKTLADVTTALQTKGTAYLARSLTATPTSRPYPNLLVVSSLVGNPHNLGGLSRVSEVFGAGAMTLQNQNVVSNKDFLSVAVSSQLHFPIIQLSASGIVSWLRERKAEGYTVVGIEQTDRSVMLGSAEARLPEKCCLVVGSEREGIPADVLIECQMLVEIEQKGVTRSLNVQTAVGIVLFEYGRQHGGKSRRS